MSTPNPPAAGAPAGPPGKSRLVLPGEGPPTFTARQEADSRRAVAHGLAEYLEQLSPAEPLGGRRVRLKQVLDEWADPEETASYPRAYVGCPSGTYEAKAMAQSLDPKCRLPLLDGRYLVVSAEASFEVAVEVWANDVEERAALCLLLERAFAPSPQRFGFVLELPHYFGARASYVPKGTAVQDGGDNALHRYRIAVVTLTATVPVINLFSFPDARPMFELTAVGAGVEVA